MRKLFPCMALLLLILGTVASVQAAGCPASIPMTSAVAAPDAEAGVSDQEVGLADILELNPLDSAEEMAPPPPNCGYTACLLTPTGCGCAGFYCNGRFICGYPWI